MLLLPTEPFMDGREADEMGEEPKLVETSRWDFLRESLDWGGDFEEDDFLGALGGKGR